MNKINHLAFHNFRKDRKQYISFGIIIFVTALILNLSLVLALSIGSAYDQKAKELHTSDIDVVIPKLLDSDGLQGRLEHLGGVESVEKQNGVMLSAIIKDFRGTDFNMSLIFYNIDNPRQVNRLETVEESETQAKNPIYLPLYIAEFGEFAVGEEITFACDGTEYTYTVAGIVQEMQYGNAGTGIIGVYLPSEPYKALRQENEANEVVNYALTTDENADNKALLGEAAETVENDGAQVMFSITNESRKQSRTMVCSLLTVILAAFAAIVLLVSVFLCKFRIKNTVDEEMAQMGVLKALGFTSGMIIAAVVLPYALTAFAASAVGAGVSYAILPSLVNMLALQAGFHFTVGFHVGALLLTVSLLTVITFGFTYFAAGRIRKLLPITAIRGISEGGQVKKNHFAIDKTPGGIQWILMLKQMANATRQNTLLFIVLFVMTSLVAFSGSMFYNVIIKPDNFMSTLSEESPDVIFQVSAADIASVKNGIAKKNEVDNVLAYAVNRGIKVESETASAFVCEDFARVRNDLCYEGRNPASDAEIAIGSAVAEATGRGIGDTAKVTYGDKSGTFKIVGLVQSVNYNGEICELTEEGFAKIAESGTNTSLYVYLKDSDDGDDFIETTERAYAGEIVNSVNYANTQSEAQGIYSVIINIVIAAIFIVTALIVLLILFVIIKSIIVQRKQEFGIYKAIGYSGRQLVTQLAGSLMPVTIAAVVSSALLGLLYVPVMNQAVFGMVGAIKNNLQVPAGILLLLAAAEILLTFAISLLLAAPIKKIEAYSLIKE